MLKLDSTDFRAQEMPGRSLGNSIVNLMKDLDGNKILLPDSYVRKKHDYDAALIPHIKHPGKEITPLFICVAI
jgi:hypothetical protein